MTTSLWPDEITGLIAVRFAYNATTVERLKTEIPRNSRQWDPERRLWLIDPPYESTARRILGLNPKPPKQNTHQPSDLDTAIATMFNRLPEHLHEATYKALVRVWHPDIGGDTRAAQALNAWHQKHAS